MESTELRSQQKAFASDRYAVLPLNDGDIEMRWQTPKDARRVTGGHPEQENLLGVVEHPLPDFDKSDTTRRLCLVALGVALCTSVGFMIGSAVMLHNLDGWIFQETSLSTGSYEIILFVVNIFVTLLTDAMGFVHGCSLRWALYHEGRLEFNTNIRLFTSAKKHAPNRWPSNVIAIMSLILCYAATSQLLVPGVVRDVTGTDSDGYYTFSSYRKSVCFNGVALFALGLGLLGQVGISAWALWSSSSRISTWSSNPLNNTLALLHRHLQRQPGRCMMSVHQRKETTKPTHPSPRQQSLARNNRSITAILVILWLIVALSLVWAITIVFVTRHSTVIYAEKWHLTSSWYPVLGDSSRSEDTYLNSISFYMQPFNNNVQSTTFYLWSTQAVLGLLFTFAVQGTQTMGLHCVELMVNMSRDEHEWRRAHIHGKGARLSTNGFIAAVKS